MTLIVWFFFITGIVTLGFYLLLNSTYLLIHLAALFKLRDELLKHDRQNMKPSFHSSFLPDVALIIPAYNEAPVIVDTVQSVLNLDYPDKEIIVVNDGSDDDTLLRLREAYALEEMDVSIPVSLPSDQVQRVYRSRDVDDLIVVDKENGGKSDALNVGVWLTDQSYFCTIDADSLIDRDGLIQVLRPFQEQPNETIACGGAVRVANGCEIESGVVRSVNLPTNPLAEIQVMEYLRAFYSGRLGLSKLNSLVLISGTFAVFRTDIVREVEGFKTDSITEDFELVVRLYRHAVETDRSFNIEFVPDPVVWTEVPDNLATLSRQRRRWYRGLINTLIHHRDMIGNPQYGVVGVFGLPFMLFSEALGRLFEGISYLLVPLGVLLGVVSIRFFVLYLVLAIGVGVFLSWFGIFSEVWSFQRYNHPREILRLMGDGIIENIGYRQWKTIIAWKGLIEYIRDIDRWGEMRRSGFGKEPEETYSRN